MRRHELLIVVLERLQPCNVADRPQRQTADLAHPLGNVVGYPENLLGLFVEQQMVVAKVWSAHVPMEVLSLHIKRKDIGQNSIELFRDFANGLGRQVRRGVQNGACFAARIESSHFVVHGITLRNMKILTNGRPQMRAEMPPRASRPTPREQPCSIAHALKATTMPVSAYLQSIGFFAVAILALFASAGTAAIPATGSIWRSS